MLRKLLLGIVFAMILSVVAGGFSSPAATCRRLTVTIADYPFFAHPICTDLPGPLQAPGGDVVVGSGAIPQLPGL